MPRRIIIEQRRHSQKDYYFKNAVGEFPHPLVCGMNDEEGKNPMSIKGAMKNLAPSETCHALIDRIAEDVENNAPDEIMMIWRKCLLSVTVQFELHTSRKTMYMRSLASRLQIMQNNETLTGQVPNSDNVGGRCGDEQAAKKRRPTDSG